MERISMPEPEDQSLSAREGFQYTYKQFIEALEIIAQEPAEQLHSNGNYNTEGLLRSLH
jgi:hypothetical protein